MYTDDDIEAIEGSMLSMFECDIYYDEARIIFRETLQNCGTTPRIISGLKRSLIVNTNYNDNKEYIKCIIRRLLLDENEPNNIGDIDLAIDFCKL